MSRKLMVNMLELAFSPVCNYDFAIIKEDELFQKFVSESTIYMITQRSELTIESFRPQFEPPFQVILHFDIKQRGNPATLHCQLPIYQPQLAADHTLDIEFHFEYALPKPDPIPMNYPQNNLHSILVFYRDKKFITWLSPEGFIQNYLRGAIEAFIDGPVAEFLKYKVHYVGKATEQEPWKRLTGHSTLQSILSLEYPFHYGTLPTHEIAILFFKLKDAIGLQTISAGDPITDDILDAFKGQNLPPEKTISLDAEKALINAMQPGYNKEFYKSFPKSKDGLYRFKFDAYSFQILSPITLVYQNGEIHGKPTYDADSIVIRKDQPVKVIEGSMIIP